MEDSLSSSRQFSRDATISLPVGDRRGRLLKTIGWAVFCLALMGSWQGAEMRPLDLFSYAGNMKVFADGFFLPDFTQWRMFVEKMLVTLQIALWGTVLAAVAAIPFGILSAENVTPWWICQPVRRLMDSFRAINEMVFAMLFSEAVEAVDPRPVEGIRATGAHPVQEVIFGIIPQVLPLWISYSLYRFESNVRSATVVGLVGAGGIGVVLWEDIRGFNYSETAAVMLIIVLTVTLLDLSSQRLRKLFT